MTNRLFAGVLLVLLLAGPALAQKGELQIEIQNIPDTLLLTNEEQETDVDGRASVFGGLKHLDLFLILDASKSLWRTDPDDYRLKAAIALIRALPAKSDIQIGIVAFDSSAYLVSPLSSDREGIIERLQTIGRDGGTNLHDGIRLALDGFDRGARAESARIALLFTDGKSNHEKAIEASDEARDRGAVVHSLLLLDRDKSAGLLRSIASTTGGSFLYVDDPEELPKAFLDLRTTGVDHVKLSVDGGAPIDTELIAGSFRGRVPLKPGKNVITAMATDLEGETAADTVEVTVTGPLRVAIAKPIDGTLFTRHEIETAVEVNASVFRTPTDDLRKAFPTLGVDSVELSVGTLPSIPTDFTGDTFVASVPLQLQANRIRATATSFDGRTSETSVDVTVRPPGCSELRVSATRDGRPAISLNDRGLEVIFDASGSMWGQIDGTAKITIAKDTVRDVMTGFPVDFFTALRVYGHQYPRQEHNCEDSELLIPLGTGNADEIRRAIERFKPKGQTPLGYSVEQVPADFGDFEGERAVVLITDGIESCDGDAVAAARGFQEEGRQRPIHVIGFGFELGQAEALESLRLIAETTGGKFITAGDAGELRRALSETAGTTFTIWSGDRQVASGTLGANESLHLAAGDYTLRLNSEPPRQFSFGVAAEESLSLTLVREGDSVSTRESRQPATYFLCEPAADTEVTSFRRPGP
jgi:Mg-chelatase subunit ChlD